MRCGITTAMTAKALSGAWDEWDDGYCAPAILLAESAILREEMQVTALLAQRHYVPYEML